jgi:centrosomal protein CEP290
MRTYEIASLHSALAESVRREQHDKLVNEHEKICEQYRLLMAKNVDMANKVKGDVDSEVCVPTVFSIVETTNAQMIVRNLTMHKEQLERLLELEKLKCVQYELIVKERGIVIGGRFDVGELSGKKTYADLSASSTQSMAQRVTLLEMKELHERQRAQHAVDMHEQARAQLTHALQRNVELETNVDTLTTTALQLQKEEQALKDQLNGGSVNDGAVWQ